MVKTGRPPKAAPKVKLNVYLDADIVEHYRSLGPGWTTALNEAVRIGTKGLFSLRAVPGPKPDMTPKVPKPRPGLRVPSEAEIRESQAKAERYVLQGGARTPPPGSMLKKR